MCCGCMHRDAFIIICVCVCLYAGENSTDEQEGKYILYMSRWPGMCVLMSATVYVRLLTE